jgi:Protein of unknown function (DUF1566)
MKRVLYCMAVLLFLSAPSMVRAQASPSLLATTDLDCNWKLDGKPQGVLKADDSTVVQVSSGKHLVQATSTDGLSTFRTVVEVEVGQGQEMVGIKLKADHQRQITETGGAQHPTWTDSSTGLMWAGKDNGSDVTWQEAGNYCQNLTLGGHSGWRLPTIDELQGIYDPSIDVPGRMGSVTVSHHVRGSLNLSGWQWSSSPGDASGAARMHDFSTGYRLSFRLALRHGGRALCVRRSGP